MKRWKRTRLVSIDREVEMKPLKVEKEKEKGETAVTITNEASNLISSDTATASNHQISGFQRSLNWLLFRSDLNKEKLDDDPVKWFELFRFTSTVSRIFLFIGILISIFIGTTRILFSYAIGQVTTEFLKTNSTSDEFFDNVSTAVGLFGGIGGVFLVGSILQHVCFRTARKHISHVINFRYMKSVLRQDSAWLDKNDAASLNAILRDNLAKIEKGIDEKLVGELFKGFSTYVGGVILAFSCQWKLAILLVLVPPMHWFFHAKKDKIVVETRKRSKKVNEEAGRIAGEALKNVKTVQALNGVQEILEKYKAQLIEEANLNIRKDFRTSFWSGAQSFFIQTLFGLAIVWGGVLFCRGKIQEAGEVFTVIYVMFAGAAFWSGISTKLMDLTSARVSAAVLYKIIDRNPEIDCLSPEGQTIPNVFGKVEFENVHFQYESRNQTPILKGFSLTVDPGTSVALVGRSGCGKTTLMKLLTRNYDLGEGSIKIDGLDIRELNIDWLRKNVGIVQQEPILFNETVRNNLLVANPNASNEDLERCAKMANAHEFIMKLPQGYDTLVGDGGIQLSGGQKQRVAIARTLMRDPKILLLDEATSSLDAHSESIVQSALNNAAKGRTTIMIAHRLSTIREADKIVVLDNGVIVESGTHQELVDLGGKYANMVHAQKFKREKEWVEVDEDVESIGEPLELLPAHLIRTRSRDSVPSEHLLLPMAPTNLEVEDYVDTSTIEDETDSQKYGFLEIYKCVKGNYKKMIVATIFGCLNGLYCVFWPFMITSVFGIFGGPQEDIQWSLLMLVPAFSLVSLYYSVSHAFGNRYYTIVSESLCRYLRVRTLDNLLQQDAAFFDDPANAHGTLTKRLSTDVPNMKYVVDTTMTDISSNTTTVIVLVIVGYYECWQIAAIASVQLAVLAVVAFCMALKLVNLETQKTKKETSGKLSAEIISNTITIQLLTAGEQFLECCEKSLLDEKKRTFWQMWFEAVNYGISSSYYYFALMICYGSGAYFLYHETVNAKAAFGAIQYMIMCSHCVTSLTDEISKFVKAKTAANFVLRLKNRKPATGNVMNGRKPPIRGDVTFESVEFSYPRRSGHKIMKNLNFVARSGQTIALVGPSGTGKSTCISMLERFYDVCEGSIKIDGQDIRTLSLYYLRQNMALVSQDPILFKGTILTNICFGLKNVTTESVMESLKLANAWEFVNNLPAGLETDVGEKGSQLSGGQKQRVAIARALVRDPKILLLDEATSALDSEAEKAVQQALDNARHGRTCITIAHRLSSIQNADLVVYIEDGNVQESGTHRQLMARRGKYYELIQKQDLAC